MPKEHRPTIRAALDVARETTYDGGEDDRERFVQRMIERILTHHGHRGVEFAADHVEYLVAKITRTTAGQGVQ